PLPAVSYAESAGTTVFANACTGGNAITFVDDGSGFGATDEGLSATTINPPAGFNFYGAPASPFRVSTNGFLAFIPPLSAAFVNQNIPEPADPNGVVAPYWADLHNITACSRLSGTKLTIQWDGSTYLGNVAVHFQVVLDGADSSIEYVWASTQAALG